MEKQKARVNLVNVDGLGRTKDYVTAKIIERVFKSTNVHQLIQNATISREQLLLLGLKNVNFEIDTAKGPGVTDYDYDLKFNIRESKRLQGGVFTTFGNRNDGKLTVQLISPNVLGAGERAAVGYERGYDKRDSSIYLELNKPLAPWSFNAPKVSVTTYQTQQAVKVSSFDQTDRGVDVDFYYNITKNFTHKLSLQNVWRQISPADRETPIKVREEAGHSLKSSLKSVITFDNRNDKVFCNRGSLIRLIQEYAGMYGNVGFYKQEIELNHYQRLPYLNSIVLQTSFNTGFLKKLENRVVCINDKFFLGGPLNLRGFQHFGIGPQNRKRPLGGTSMWLSGLHLYFPLPLIKASWKNLFRVHAFVNAGNIVETNDNVNIYDYKMLNALTNNIRVSYGAGFIMKLGDSAKIELNYVLPFKSQDSDLIDDGIQFGIGFSF